MVTFWDQLRPCVGDAFGRKEVIWGPTLAMFLEQRRLYLIGRCQFVCLSQKMSISTVRAVKNTPKCARLNCILARGYSLGFSGCRPTWPSLIKTPQLIETKSFTFLCAPIAIHSPNRTFVKQHTSLIFVCPASFIFLTNQNRSCCGHFCTAGGAQPNNHHPFCNCHDQLHQMLSQMQIYISTLTITDVSDVMSTITDV